MKLFFRKYWLWIFAVIYTLLIFNNSGQTGEESGNLSAAVTQIVSDLLSGIGLSFPFDALHFFIRKLAHFSEYFLLAIIVFQANYRQPVFHKPWLCILLWMLIPPLLDETIQLFTPGRAGMVTDSLLDMSGYLCGWIISQVVYRLKNKSVSGQRS